MQHPPELKTKFLELRAQGVSYGRIAETISVSKPTLIQWGKAMAEEIADLQAAERELVREKLLGNFEQWLGRQIHHFNRLDAEFGRRELKYSHTESVFRMMMASRKVLDRYFFEDDRPSQRRTSERRAPSSPPAIAAHTPLPQREGTGEGQNGNLDPAPSPSVEPTGGTENPSETQPFPNQDNGAGEKSVAGKFISALHRLQTSEAGSPNESIAMCPHRAGAQQSEIESSAPAYSENPAKTLTFPSQNSGGHNSNLSAGSELEGEVLHEVSISDSSRVSPPASVGTDLSQTRQINHPNHGNSGSGAIGNSGPFPRLPHPHHAPQPAVGSVVPSAPPPLPKGSADSKIDNPISRIAEPSDAETDFGGESVPVNPFESTRQWLERQGIQVSKIPKGARIITAT